MAKYYTTYKINSKYTAPKETISFDFYKSGFWDGMGDISYYMTKIGNKDLAKEQFSRDNYTKQEEYISNFVSFVHTAEFDTLSRQEFEYIKSEEFLYICRFLNGSQYKFNNNFTSIEFSRKFDHFTINDVGKLKGSGNRNNTITARNFRTGMEEEFYVGCVSFSKYNSSILIPVVNFHGVGRVEIKEIKTNINLFKCLCFALKISLLCGYLYPYMNGATWEHNFSIYAYEFEDMLRMFNFYSII